MSLQNQPDDELEILLVTAKGPPIRKRQWGVTRAQVDQVAAEFRRQATVSFQLLETTCRPLSSFING